MIICLYILFLTASCLSSNVEESNSRKISRSHFYFSVDLYRTLLEDEDEDSNVIFSPFAVYSTLSMLFLGTTSSTGSSRQLRSGLNLNHMSYVDIHRGFKRMLRSSRKRNKNFSYVNGFFLRRELKVSPHYERGLSEYYYTTLKRLNFQEEEPFEKINEWCNRSTGGRFPRILIESLPSETDLFLINAFGVDSDWMIPFPREDTSEKGLFFLPDNRRIEIPMMSTTGYFPHGYSDELKCRVLEIPFSKRQVSLFILLPDNAGRGTSELEKNLTTENIRLIISKLKNKATDVRLPRFKVSSEVDIVKALKKLGILDIFDPHKSDLSLITPSYRLHVSDIAHKSQLQAKESDDTHHSKYKSSGRKEPIHDVFEVDHPFVFLVWDYYSGMLLLMGRVLKPETL